MALVGTLGFNFQVVLPLLARIQLRRRRDAYAALVSRDGRSARSSAPSSTARTVAPARA